ncbi:MAG: FAD-dependent oxidoreductase [Leadbetterella sp.]
MQIINFEAIAKSFEADILVVGAGSAGCTAAITAAKYSNASVFLVERYGFPGGSSTQMLDTFYGFFTPGDTPKKVVGGIPDLVVNSLNELGEVFLRPNTYGAGTGVNYNPERLKNVWDQLILGSGVKYMLHCTLVAVDALQDGRYACVFYSKSGFFKVIAKKVIDASGDADFCHFASFDYEIAGELEPAQSMTTTFRMSNVDLAEYDAAGGKKMLIQKMKESVENGSHPLPRKEGSAHEMNAQKCISTVAVKVGDKSALNVWDLTDAEIEGRRQAFVFEKFFQHQVPGYQNSNIIGLSHQIGVRETRRVYGEHRLTKEDCMTATMPSDTIFLCGAPIEDHRQGANGESETVWEYVPNYGVYGVSYGTIVPKSSENVWVVGRCFSATHDAHASCRSMAQTMSMGQAAGLAAAQAFERSESAKGLDTQVLRNKIIEIGGILEMPTKQANIGRNDWDKN